MPLEKYKVLESEIKDGTAYLPKKAIPLGIWTLQELPPKGDRGIALDRVPLVLYKVNIAFMMKYKDWAKEFPDDALKEAILRDETSKKGTEDAQ